MWQKTLKCQPAFDHFDLTGSAALTSLDAKNPVYTVTYTSLSQGTQIANNNGQLSKGTVQSVTPLQQRQAVMHSDTTQQKRLSTNQLQSAREADHKVKCVEFAVCEAQ
jgi:hypothetical protein